MWAVLMLFVAVFGICCLLSKLAAVTDPFEAHNQSDYEYFRSPLHEGIFLSQSLLENDFRRKQVIKEGDFFSEVSTKHNMADSSYKNYEGSFFSALLAENREISRNNERWSLSNYRSL